MRNRPGIAVGLIVGGCVVETGLMGEDEVVVSPNSMTTRLIPAFPQWVSV